MDNPSYMEVCSGMTGHAEVVRIEYDPDLITFDRLLDIFWRCHDPTSLNQQGLDFGTQYRSIIFTYDSYQREVAIASKFAQGASGRFRSPIVTEIAAAQVFYPAEEHHQQYFEKRGWRRCCN